MFRIRTLRHTVSLLSASAALLALIHVTLPIASTQAGPITTAARELVAELCQKFGLRLSKSAADELSASVSTLVTRYGDEGADALRKVGPDVIKLSREAGEAGEQAITLLARHGNEAVWVVSQPKRLANFVKHGDDAATAMVKHGDVVVPLLERFGKKAASATTQVSDRNVRRIVMLQDDKLFEAVPGESEKLFEVISKYGDEAAEFIWRNKGALAVSATLIAFVSHPEPFLRGAQQLGDTLAEEALAPVLTQASASFPWHWFWVVTGIASTLMLLRLVRSKPRFRLPPALRGVSEGGRWQVNE